MYINNCPTTEIDAHGLIWFFGPLWKKCPKGQVWTSQYFPTIPPIDGCSVPTLAAKIGKLFGGSGQINSPFAGCSFRSACDAHDGCYRDCQKSKSECDDAFLSDMIAACATCTTVGSKARGECEKWAKTYRWGVGAAGNSAYKERQQDACECACKEQNPMAIYVPGTGPGTGIQLPPPQ